MTLVLERPCAPWCTPEDMPCPLDVYDDELVLAATRACEIASVWLYRATGRRISGLCSDVVRPGGGCAVQWLAYSSGGARPIIHHGPEGSCGGCSIFHGALELVAPIVTIDEVWVDGAQLATTEYFVVDRRYLLRVGGSWPCTQRLEVADHDEGGFTVEYTYGISPSTDDTMAAAVLACEILKDITPGEGSCLPPDLQTLSREGATFGDVTFEAAQSSGPQEFGIGFVDRYVRSVNPHGLDEAPLFIDPRRMPLHRRL